MARSDTQGPWRQAELVPVTIWPISFLGLPNSYSQYPNAFSAAHGQQYGIFGQDEWRVKPNLTLTLGLRYEYDTPKHDPQEKNYFLLPGQQSTKYPLAPEGLLFPCDPHAPCPGTYFPDKNNLGAALRFCLGSVWQRKNQYPRGRRCFLRYPQRPGCPVAERNASVLFGFEFDFHDLASSRQRAGHVHVQSRMERPAWSIPSHPKAQSRDEFQYGGIPALWSEQRFYRS